MNLIYPLVNEYIRYNPIGYLDNTTKYVICGQLLYFNFLVKDLTKKFD